MGQPERNVQERATTTRMPLPLGFGPEAVQISPAFEGILGSGRAASQVESDMLKELRIITERLGVMIGIPPTGAAPSGGTVTQARAQSLSPPPAHAKETPPPPGRAPSPAHEGDVVTTAAMDQDRTVAPAHTGDDYGRIANYFGTRAGGGFDISNIRQDVGSWAERKLENRTWGPQINQDVYGRYHDERGRFLSPTNPAVIKMLNREKVMMAGRGFAQTLAGGGTMGEAGIGAIRTAPGGMAALRLAGGVVAAAHAVDMVADWGQRQRAENAQWQRMLGGTNAEGFIERGRQNLFGFSQIGFMDAAEAERLYAGVAATGMGREDRNRAQQFALENYRQFGMTIDQSMEIINVAAKTGQESLLGLSSALDSVTDSAREAGVNAEVARQRMVEMWTAASTNIGGQAAAVVAAGAGAAVTEMGRPFTDVVPTIGTSQIRRYAAAQGVSEGVFRASLREPGGGTRLLQAQDADIRDRIERSMQPEGRALMAPFKAIIDAGGTLTPSQEIEMQQIMDMWGPPPETQMMLMTEAGVPGLNEANVTLWTAKSYTGQYSSAEAYEEQQADLAPRQIDVGTQRAGGGPMGVGGAMALASRGAGGPGMAAQMSPEYRELEKRVRGSATGGIFNFTEDSILTAYLEDVVESGGVAGGISEKLATSATARSSVSKVEVVDPDGTRRVVSLQEAMANYRKQLDDGSARVVSEEGGDMGAIGDLIGGGLGGAGAGTGASEGKVLFDATPYLRNLIKPIETSGNAYVNPASMWEAPPSQILPSDRPTGQP